MGSHGTSVELGRHVRERMPTYGAGLRCIRTRQGFLSRKTSAARSASLFIPRCLLLPTPFDTAAREFTGDMGAVDELYGACTSFGMIGIGACRDLVEALAPFGSVVFVIRFPTSAYRPNHFERRELVQPRLVMCWESPHRANCTGINRLAEIDGQAKRLGRGTSGATVILGNVPAWRITSLATGW
jgi:hypothetical protein